MLSAAFARVTLVSAVRSALVPSRRLGVTAPGVSQVDVTHSPHITGAAIDAETSHVSVAWSGSPGGAAVSTFPSVYLRDNCVSNFSAHTNQRTTFLRDMDLGVRATHVRVAADGAHVEVQWSDGANSWYSAHWLREHCLSRGNREQWRNTRYRIRPALWDRHYITQNLGKFSFADILANDHCLHDWMEQVERLGLAVICDAPRTSGLVATLAARVPFIKTTHFGNMFDVKSKLNPSNLAYTAKGLALHVDLPQCDYTPCIQMLHCIQQSSTGGDNLFVDSFQAAEVLKERHPEYYDFLCRKPLYFADVGVDYIPFHMWAKQTTIQLNEHGEYERVIFNNTTRSSFLDLDVDDVNTMYAALHAYNELLNSEELLFSYKMVEGDIVCFHNTRVLHGRKEYDSSEGAGGERWLQGIYIDTDQFRSKLRVLKHQLGYINTPNTNWK